MPGGIDWFRWHHGTVSDPKLAMVAAECHMPLSCVIGLWAYILEAASASEVRGQVDGFDYEVASFHLGVDVETPCNAMKRRGMLHETDGTLYVSNWEKRQVKREREDHSTSRVQKHRLLKNQQVTEQVCDETPCNAVKRQETPRGEKRREEDICVATPSALPPQVEKIKRKTRLPDDFHPNETCVRKAAEMGVDLSAELEKFKDYHTAKASTMADWQAAFRTWLGNARPTNRQPSKELKFGSDEYFEYHRQQTWWKEAGFSSVWEAVSARCHHKNSHEFRNGQYVGVAA